MQVNSSWTAVYTATIPEIKSIMNEGFTDVRIERGTIAPTELNDANRLSRDEYTNINQDSYFKIVISSLINGFDYNSSLSILEI